MNSKIEKDRQLLLIFSLLWAVSALWAFHYYPIIKDFDFSKVQAEQLNTLFLISLMNMFSLVMTSKYVYKICRWYNSPKMPPMLLTVIFVISAFSFGLASMIIVAMLYIRSKKLLK